MSRRANVQVRHLTIGLPTVCRSWSFAPSMTGSMAVGTKVRAIKRLVLTMCPRCDVVSRSGFPA